MDCHNGTTTVDLCSEPECINSAITFEATDRKPHLPTHGMFKVCRIIFDRDIGRIESVAKDALNAARGTILRLQKEKKQMPECVRCKTTVSFPCWCCVECAGEREPGNHNRNRNIINFIHLTYRREVLLRQV